MHPDFPSGTITFLFTDLEGSTGLWKRFPKAMQGVMSQHDAFLREAVVSCEGIVVKTTGDGLPAVFAAASDGAAAAEAAQGLLEAKTWQLASSFAQALCSARPFPFVNRPTHPAGESSKGSTMALSRCSRPK